MELEGKDAKGESGLIYLSTYLRSIPFTGVVNVSIATVSIIQ